VPTSCNELRNVATYYKTHLAYDLIIFNIYHLYISISYSGRVPVNNGWRTGCGKGATVLENTI
jgi:hypothetical protein